MLANTQKHSSALYICIPLRANPDATNCETACSLPTSLNIGALTFLKLYPLPRGRSTLEYSYSAWPFHGSGLVLTPNSEKKNNCLSIQLFPLEDVVGNGLSHCVYWN